MGLVVVFDANVYIDACIELDAGTAYPAAWAPVHNSRRAKSLACCSCVASIAAQVELSLYSDGGVDDLVLRKLSQPRDGARPEDRGLGWDLVKATATYRRLTDALDQSGRSLFMEPDAAARHLSGVDFEDQRIFGLFPDAAATAPWSDAALVTNDREFATQVNSHAPMLASGHAAWIAVSPSRFLAVAAGL